MPRFRKRAFEVEARQFTGDNSDELAEWCNARTGSVGGRPVLWLEGLDSSIRISRGDWIVKGADSVFHTYSSSGFNAIYEPVEDVV